MSRLPFYDNIELTPEELEGRCLKCGITKKRKHWKLLMAITNHPPYNHYMHGCDMAYSNDDFKTWEFKAPICTASTTTETP